MIEAIRWSAHGVTIVDQRRLPGEFVERELRTLDDVCDAIATLAVRGAPAIGIAGAMGLAVLAAGAPAANLRAATRAAADRIRATRPTAVNLGWAMDRMLARADRAGQDRDAIVAALRDEACAILEEDRAMCRRIGEHALALFPEAPRVLTHCNAGALATGGIGTALAPVYLAAQQGRRVTVFAGETRPLLQGSRLTAWELSRAGIPVTILADAAAASLLRSGAVDLVIVGADRIAANGDVANKIGTYALALAAREHGIPFYVAAPWSTFDPAAPDGAAIPVEQRAADEVRRAGAGVVAAEAAEVYNPAFDVTPAALITAIVSDRGVHRPPYRLA